MRPIEVGDRVRLIDSPFREGDFVNGAELSVKEIYPGNVYRYQLTLDSIKGEVINFGLFKESEVERIEPDPRTEPDIECPGKYPDMIAEAMLGESKREPTIHIENLYLTINL